MNKQIERATWESSIEHYPKKPNVYAGTIVTVALIALCIWIAVTLTHILNFMIAYGGI